MLADSAVCTTPMCDSGSASVSEMDNVYQSLPIDTQSRFQSAHDSIMASYNANYSFYDDWIPFNPVCCTLQQIGQQADTLTNQMQLALGQVPTAPGPGTQSQGMSLQSMIILGAVGYLAFVYLASHH